MVEDLQNEFSTLCFLHSFSKTITTILDILENDSEHAESPGHKQIIELLSNEQWGLAKAIQDIEPKLSEKSELLDRDTRYATSIAASFDIVVQEARQRFNLK